MHVAIQGMPGSFHHQAATQYFKNDQFDLISCSTFRDVFDQVSNKKANYGIVAVENSLHGSINQVYRLLAQEKLWVCGEIRLKIELFLIGTGTVETDRLNALQTVFSQAEAFSQCEMWLHGNLPNALIVEKDDTAGSVQWVTEHPTETTAAIASKEAANLYDGTILAGPINDDPDNYTRFFVLAKKPIESPETNRTSIIITETSTDSPGSLYEALGIFKEAEINLSKLDSHPLPGSRRRYAFYIDTDCGLDTFKNKEILEQLQQIGWAAQVLGSYKT